MAGAVATATVLPLQPLPPLPPLRLHAAVFDALVAWASSPAPRSPPAVFLHGGQGVGKTTLAHAALRAAGYAVVEWNAAVHRHKAAVEEGLLPLLQSANVSDFFRSEGHRPLGIVVDEVDGMAVGDRGGLAELVRLLREHRGKNAVVAVSNEWGEKKYSAFTRWLLPLAVDAASDDDVAALVRHTVVGMTQAAQVSRASDTLPIKGRGRGKKAAAATVATTTTAIALAAPATTSVVPPLPPLALSDADARRLATALKAAHGGDLCKMVQTLRVPGSALVAALVARNALGAAAAVEALLVALRGGSAGVLAANAVRRTDTLNAAVGRLLRGSLSLTADLPLTNNDLNLAGLHLHESLPAWLRRNGGAGPQALTTYAAAFASIVASDRLDHALFFNQRWSMFPLTYQAKLQAVNVVLFGGMPGATGTAVRWDDSDMAYTSVLSRQSWLYNQFKYSCELRDCAATDGLDAAWWLAALASAWLSTSAVTDTTTATTQPAKRPAAPKRAARGAKDAPAATVAADAPPPSDPVSTAMRFLLPRAAAVDFPPARFERCLRALTVPTVPPVPLFTMATVATTAAATAAAAAPTPQPRLSRS